MYLHGNCEVYEQLPLLLLINTWLEVIKQV